MTNTSETETHTMTMTNQQIEALAAHAEGDIVLELPFGHLEIIKVDREAAHAADMRGKARNGLWQAEEEVKGAGGSLSWTQVNDLQRKVTEAGKEFDHWTAVRDAANARSKEMTDKNIEAITEWKNNNTEATA